MDIRNSLDHQGQVGGRFRFAKTSPRTLSGVELEMGQDKKLKLRVHGGDSGLQESKLYRM